MKYGSILRTETGRVSTLTCDSSGQVLGVHGASGVYEMFIFVPRMEAMRRFKKRKNKEKKKAG